YGPQYHPGQPDEERGVMFMAYNASIAEQFEVVQRWISGGNSSGTYSGQGDPRTFWFPHNGAVQRCELGADPFVVLQWGAYLFAPSPAALQMIANMRN